MPKIDIIAPVRDEGETLPAFAQKAMSMTLSPEVSLGIIFVEDGSRDRTVSALRELSAVNSSVRFFSLRNNRGQAAAVAFGMKQSSADAIIMMDADGSHPLQIVPEMIARFRSGADVVQAVRIESGQEVRYRRAGSRMLNTMIYILTGVRTQRQNVYFRLISRDISQRLLKNNRFLYFFRTNFPKRVKVRQEYVYFRESRRKTGRSKYGLGRLIKVAMAAPFSVISTGRFIALAGLAGLAGAVCLAVGRPAEALVLLALDFVAILKFLRMSRTDITGQVAILEQSPSLPSR